jgi:cysteinyl-tRNA synthetase
MDLTWNSITASHKNLNRIREKMQEYSSFKGSVEQNYLKQFELALTEDLDTNKVLQLLRTLEKDENVSPGDKYQTIAKFDEVLGLDLTRAPEKTPDLVITPEIKELIEKRIKAREEKNWQLSDELRNQLAGLGIGVKDSAQGQEIVPL